MLRPTNVEKRGRRRAVAWFPITRGLGVAAVGVPSEEQEQEEERRELQRAVERLEQSYTPPPSKGYLSLLKSCHKHKSLPHARRIQAHLSHHSYLLDGVLGENLVITLVKCGDPDTALHVFYQLPRRTTFSWTAIISGLVSKGCSQDALTMYLYMQEEGVEPDHYTFVCLLKACGSIPDLIEGKSLHAQIRRKGLMLDVFIGTTLISMYGKCGAINEAENVFLELPSRNIVTWNSMLSAYVEQSQGDKALCLYQQMRGEAIIPNSQTLLIAIQARGTLADQEDTELNKEHKVFALDIVRALHSKARSRGFMKDVYIGNTLVSLYGKCDSATEGENVFACFSQRDVVSWTALISMYVELDQGEKALQTYQQMQVEGVNPNQQTCVSVLQACCILVQEGNALQRHLISLEIGRALDEDARRMFNDLDAFVGTTLIGVYAKCGAMVEAERVFNGLNLYTIVQWNGMLSAFVEQGEGIKALLCYRQLRERGLCPNQGTYVIALQACNTLSEEREGNSLVEEQQERETVHEIGQALHADARKAGFASDVVVGTALVTMYGKCGTVEEAESIFSALSHHNIIAWNAMLSAYVDRGQGEKALHFYNFLLSNLSIPNLVTLICVLRACSESGSLENCCQLHFTAVTSGQDAQDFLASTLVHAYGNCASITDAHAVFNGLTKPLIASWNACLAGYASEGDRVACWHLFLELHQTFNEPTGTTFTSLLSACSHAGLLDEGIVMFEAMRVEFGLKPDVKHYVSLIDLLGRSGNLNMVERIIDKFPASCDLSIWLCLLGACRAHSNVRLGKFAFDHAVRLRPREATPYVLMANVYGCLDMQVAMFGA